MTAHLPRSEITVPTKVRGEFREALRDSGEISWRLCRGLRGESWVLR
ncbi:MAG: hypothetical protein ABWK01_02090 [Infirmifilum sp.]